MMNIVLFGPPGSGKGTQAEFIAARYDLLHLSTGEVLRRAISRETELGLIAKRYIDKGELLPDKYVNGIAEEYIKEHADVKGFIFDGYPRTVDQAEFLDGVMNDIHSEIHILISLDVETDELVKRILLRGENCGRKDDQRRETIENRIDVYHKKTEPVENFYKEQGKLRKIDGIGRIEDISKDILSVLDALK